MAAHLERRKTRQLRAALAALLLGAALPSPTCKAQTAHAPPTSDTVSPNVPEVKHLTFTHTFPINPFQGAAPPGCAVSQTMTVCRTDKQPAKSFEAQAYNALGWATDLQKSELVNGCAVLHARLSVDNAGPEGRTCLTPFSRLEVDVTLH